ncbi:Phr family secreted Rap phosphatase inhibitor [Bacillus arachidis]|uniref:Phr family secreted Rap phosphatase inhibitor n=1 Tax=Bacillus arachidis TaxID=2819290 RepID=A0ABS3P5A2_9BACI|nr:Phr family secreted Rap phosphatase inhibitor [Bacillus arachidis]MBO1627992.1 Phr family secreted Rap phosphatase inhibitor [Bacillus arachidis]
MKKLKIILMGIMVVGILTLGLNPQGTENSTLEKYSVYRMADGNTG